MDEGLMQAAIHIVTSINYYQDQLDGDRKTQAAYRSHFSLPILRIGTAPLNVDVAKLSTISSDAIIQIPRINPTRCPVQIDEVISRWVLRKDIHPVLGVLHLPNPPDAVDHAVMEPKEWITRGREEVL
jgi:hypothetical protein